jgi:DNA-binding NtrC family response regulator
MLKTKLLIVDNDLKALTNLQICLVNEGYKVLTSNNRSQTLDAVKNENIAVCLIDLHLKNGRGAANGQRIAETGQIFKNHHH